MEIEKSILQRAKGQGTEEEIAQAVARQAGDSRWFADAELTPGQLLCQAKASGEAGMLFAEFLTKELQCAVAQSELNRTRPAAPEECTQRRAFPRSQRAHLRLRQVPIR